MGTIHNIANHQRNFSIGKDYESGHRFIDLEQDRTLELFCVKDSVLTEAYNYSEKNNFLALRSALEEIKSYDDNAEKNAEIRDSFIRKSERSKKISDFIKAGSKIATKVIGFGGVLLGLQTGNNTVTAASALLIGAGDSAVSLFAQNSLDMKTKLKDQEILAKYENDDNHRRNLMREIKSFVLSAKDYAQKPDESSKDYEKRKEQLFTNRAMEIEESHDNGSMKVTSSAHKNLLSKKKKSSPAAP